MRTIFGTISNEPVAIYTETDVGMKCLSPQTDGQTFPGMIV
jgi:hypothetical protein